MKAKKPRNSLVVAMNKRYRKQIMKDRRNKRDKEKKTDESD